MYCLVNFAVNRLHFHKVEEIHMKLPKPFTLQEICGLISCDFIGDPEHEILGINEIHMVEPGDIVFVDHPKYYEKALNSAATTIIINKEVAPPAGKALILHEDPFRIFNNLTLHFSPKQLWHDTASAVVDSSAKIAAGVPLGVNVQIGARSVIHPGVVIYDNVKVGDDVEIHSGTIIGSHAFYYKKYPEGFVKMHSCGSVVIEDGVEIGAGCTVDKGVSGITRIGAGTKIDNQVHIGHDTVIGKGCLIAAQVGVAGCVVIEDGVTLWGQVGVRSDITLGRGSVVLAQSGLTKDLEPGKVYFGSPASESRDKLKELANTRKIPEILADIAELKRRLNEG